MFYIPLLVISDISSYVANTLHNESATKIFKRYGLNSKTEISEKHQRKSNTWAGALATVTRSEFFSHIVTTAGGGGLGKSVNEDMISECNGKQTSETEPNYNPLVPVAQCQTTGTVL